MNQPLWKAVGLFACFGIPTFLLNAQNAPAGSRSAAMGNSSVTFSDVWASFNNQAGLANLKGVQAGVFYENRFLLPELSRQGLAVSVPVKKVGTFGLNFTRFGYSLYNESKFGFCYARKFGPVFSMGMQINLHWIHLGDVYGDLVTATGELSFLVKPTRKWLIAGHVFNPTRTPLADDQREKINTVFRLGTSYQFHEKVIASVEMEASIENLPVCRAGAEYRPVKLLYIRAGFISYPVAPTFGFGLYIKKFQMDVAALWNPLLGFSPQASLSYDFGK